MEGGGSEGREGERERWNGEEEEGGSGGGREASGATRVVRRRLTSIERV